MIALEMPELRLALAEIIRQHADRIIEEVLRFRFSEEAFHDPARAAELGEWRTRVTAYVNQIATVLAARDEPSLMAARDAFYDIFRQQGWRSASRGDPLSLQMVKSVNFASLVWRTVEPELIARFTAPRDAIIACRQLSEYLVQIEAAYAFGYAQFELESVRAREQTVNLLLRELREAEERERQRIASGLHDGPGQLLVDLHQGIQLCQRLLSTAPERCAEELALLQQVARDGIQEIRQLIYEMRPVQVAEGGLRNALQQYVSSFQRLTGITTRFRASGTFDFAAGPSSLLMLVAQEALANVRKHAEATRVSVELEETADRVILRVRDNGKGFEVWRAARRSQAGQTYGLALMRQRMEILGGTLDLTSQAGKGTTVEASLPKQRLAPEMLC